MRKKTAREEDAPALVAGTLVAQVNAESADGEEEAHARPTERHRQEDEIRNGEMKIADPAPDHGSTSRRPCSSNVTPIAWTRNTIRIAAPRRWSRKRDVLVFAARRRGGGWARCHRLPILRAMTLDWRVGSDISEIRLVICTSGQVDRSCKVAPTLPNLSWSN